MKVLCIGDSLAMPGHGNLCEDTWFYKLQDFYKETIFFSFFRRGITTNILSIDGGGDEVFPHGADCLEFYLPDAVVMQLGIVDCAPRLFKEGSLIPKILGRTPEQPRRALIYFIKKVKKRTISNAYVSPEKFRQNLINYVKRCEIKNLKKLIFLKICTPDETFRQKSPDIQEAIDIYNKIFDEVAKDNSMIIIIDPLGQTQDKIFADGYHPNPKGNEIVFQAVKKALDC